MPVVLDLQVANGIKMGRGDAMKKKITKYMIEKDVKFGILIDECTIVSHLTVLSVWRGRQPIDIHLSVMAVTRRGLPIESITGAEALVESCGDGEPQKKKRETEQSISSSRGETLGSPVYEREQAEGASSVGRRSGSCG
ncbi:UNVERIFIED_CONTAM: hypothetical protein FKN15_062383 [Acipenser sinensis]